jgi:DNA-binding response OmpR family regulator
MTLQLLIRGICCVGPREVSSVHRQPLVLLLASDGLTRVETGNGFAMYGYEVVMAKDGEQAVELLRTNKNIGILVTDADIGGPIDGLAVARLAREINPRIEVLYTSRAPQHIAETARVAGAPMIRTPYHPQQLVGVIAQLRHRPDAKRPAA